MKWFALFSRLALTAVVSTGGLKAEEGLPLTFAFKMGGGPTSGGIKSVSGAAGYLMGADLEVGYRRGASSYWFALLGVRWEPGHNKMISYIPVSVPATGVNPTHYESRDRFLETQSFLGTLGYRQYLVEERLYAHAGLKFGVTRTSETDTGSRIVTDGRAISNTGAATPAGLLAVETIASRVDERHFSVGAQVGMGYSFGKYMVEINAFSMGVKTPTDGTKNGVAAEMILGIRF